MDPVKLYALADDLLGHVRTVSDSILPAGYRFERSHVVNGPAPLDGIEECVEHLVVWAEMVTATEAFPAPAGRALTCAGMGNMVQLTVQSLRCEPILDERGFPADVERDAAARLVYVDAWVAWNACTEWALARNVTDDESALMISGSPVPPSRVAGWETRLLVEVDYCRAGPPHVPFPAGFFDPIEPRS